jgi:hypothetical protein
MRIAAVFSPLATALTFGVALCLFAVSASAQAQAPAPAPASSEAGTGSPEYKELVRNAVLEFELGHWTEARVYFSQAHALSPSARTLRGLALVSFESRRYVEMLSYGEQALASQVQPLTGPLRSDFIKKIESARSFVARVRIVTDPADAELRIDGQPAVRNADAAVLLDDGSHQLVASAPGYQTHTRELHVDGGTDARFDVPLTREPIAKQTPPALPPPPAAGPAALQVTESSGSIVPWIVVGSGAAVAIGGGVLLALGLSDKSKVEKAKDGANWPEIRDAWERAPTLLTVGWVMVGVGVAGAATGLTWKLAFDEASDRAPRAQLRVQPGGLQLAGTF